MNALVVAGLVIAVPSSLVNSLSLRCGKPPARSSPRAASCSGLVLSFALIYVTSLTYALGKLESKADFSYFRTAKPSESTLK